jgi:hypothetical protein
MHLFPARLRRTAARRLARLSVTLPQDQAEPLRYALFRWLHRRARWVALSSRIELGTREMTLDVALEPDAIDEALHVVMTTVSCARIGHVSRPAATTPDAARERRGLPTPSASSAQL